MRFYRVTLYSSCIYQVHRSKGLLHQGVSYVMRRDFTHGFFQLETKWTRVHVCITWMNGPWKRWIKVDQSAHSIHETNPFRFTASVTHRKVHLGGTRWQCVGYYYMLLPELCNTTEPFLFTSGDWICQA